MIKSHNTDTEIRDKVIDQSYKINSLSTCIDSESSNSKTSQCENDDFIREDEETQN